MGSARHAVRGRPVAVGLRGPGGGGLRVEANGINVIVDAERRGRARELFWPWFGANVSVLGLSYGAFALGFGISFWQAAITGLIGIVFSSLLCGFVALAGKRGSAPTMVLSRAAFGVRGNRLPALISWLMTVGWETVLTIIATLATATVFHRLGWGSGYQVQVVALVVVAALTVSAGVLGFDVIMRLQRVLTVVTALLTVIYIILVLPQIDWSTVAALPAGSAAQVVGALVFFMTGFGLGWVNVAADYSRYLPRSAPARSVVGWTTFGSSLAPLVLLVVGLLLAGSSPRLAAAIATDPVGAIAMTLPIWFLVPFAVVAVLGLVGGAVIDIYSSGLALLAAGHFLGEFTGFLITLGVPIAAWCGVILADVLVRRSDYDDNDLYRPAGRYGDVRVGPIVLIVLATVLGWGLVTNAGAEWLQWQGYLLGPFGGRQGEWAGANLGVLVALVVPFAVTLLADHARTEHARRRVAEPVPRFRQA